MVLFIVIWAMMGIIAIIYVLTKSEQPPSSGGDIRGESSPSQWNAQTPHQHQYFTADPKHKEKLDELRSNRVLRGNSEIIQAIDGQEHRVLLVDALTTSTSTVCIISGWIRQEAVDDILCKLIDSALQRGVSLFVGYGYQGPRDSQDEHDRMPSLIAFNQLKEIHVRATMRRYSGNLVVSKFATHQKILTCDRRYAACGSYNWLAGKGFRNTERSFRVWDPSVVVREREAALAQILEGEIVIGKAPCPIHLDLLRDEA